MVIKVELTCHPGSIGTYPKRDGDIVIEVCADRAGTPGQVNSHIQGGYDHEHTQRLEEQAPAGIFDQPECDVQILVFADVHHQFIQI